MKSNNSRYCVVRRLNQIVDFPNVFIIREGSAGLLPAGIQGRILAKGISFKQAKSLLNISKLPPVINGRR